MNLPKVFMFICWVSIIPAAQAQSIAKQIALMEEQHKECLRIKPDSMPCSRAFLGQMDSMLVVVLDKAKEQVPINEKSSLLQDQLSWTKKKAEFFKVQEETFKANIADGTWKKDMIRITYQQKAEFLLKRIKVLLKKLKE